MTSKSKSQGTWALKVALIAGVVYAGVEVMKRRSAKPSSKTR